MAQGWEESKFNAHTWVVPATPAIWDMLRWRGQTCADSARHPKHKIPRVGPGAASIQNEHPHLPGVSTPHLGML